MSRDTTLRLSPVSNPFLFAATLGALAIHVASLYLPATQYVLRVEPIEAAAWIRIVAVAFSILIAIELHKLIRARFPLRPGAEPERPEPRVRP